MRFFQWVNVPALEIFNQLRLQCFRIGKVDDANGYGFRLGQLRGAVTTRSGHDLEAAFIQRPYQQGREYALTANGCGQFFQCRVLEDATRVGFRFTQYSEWKVAVFRSCDILSRHDALLLWLNVHG